MAIPVFCTNDPSDKLSDLKCMVFITFIVIYALVILISLSLYLMYRWEVKLSKIRNNQEDSS